MVASEKGVVVGRLAYREDGDLIDCQRMGVGGKAIPPNVDKVQIWCNPCCLRASIVAVHGTCWAVITPALTIVAKVIRVPETLRWLEERDV